MKFHTARVRLRQPPLWQWLLIVLVTCSLFPPSVAQTCWINGYWDGVACKTCPAGMGRAATAPVEYCYVNDNDCFRPLSTFTQLVCNKDMKANNCKVVCASSIKCRQSGLTCPANYIMNSLKDCTAGSAEKNPNYLTQCTTSYCCLAACPAGSNGAYCQVGTTLNMTYGVCQNGVCTRPPSIACNYSGVICTVGLVPSSTRNCSQAVGNCISANCCVGQCSDGVQNGLETGVDCGGPNCPACVTCFDNIQNGNETGMNAVDCGGPNCPACPTCSDGIRNGFETGIDCGGTDCPPCVISCTDSGIQCLAAPNTTVSATATCVANVNCTAAVCCVDMCTTAAANSICYGSTWKCINGKCTAPTSVLCRTIMPAIKCSAGYSVKATETCLRDINCDASTCCTPTILFAQPLLLNSGSTCTTLVSNGQCLCNSGRYGDECESSLESCTMAQQNLIVDTSNTIGAATAAVVDDNIVITVQLRIVQGRKYTAVTLNSCVPGDFILAVQTPNATSCSDIWTISVPTSILVATCGVTVTQIGAQYEKFLASIGITYTDALIVVAGALTPRTVHAIIPVVLSLQTSYTASMTFSVLAISSPEIQLRVGITAASILVDSSNSTFGVTLEVTYPYMIHTMNSQLVGTDNGAITAEAVHSTTIQPFDTPQFSLQQCLVADYVEEEDVHVCSRTMIVMFHHNGGCQLQGQFELTNITYSCAADLNPSDCPLQSVATAANATFRVSSDNFCSSQAEANIVNNTVSITRFYVPSNTTLIRNDSAPLQPSLTWKYNDVLPIRADFDGLPIYAATIVRVSSSVNGGDMMLRYTLLQTDELPSPPASQYTGAYNGVPLGLDVSLQSFLFALKIDAGLGVSAIQRGTSTMFTVQVGFSLKFEASGRRRRRYLDTSDTVGVSGSTAGVVLYSTGSTAQAEPVVINKPGDSSRNALYAAIFGGVSAALALLLIAAAIRIVRRRRKAHKISASDFFAQDENDLAQSVIAMGGYYDALRSSSKNIRDEKSAVVALSSRHSANSGELRFRAPKILQPGDSQRFVDGLKSPFSTPQVPEFANSNRRAFKKSMSLHPESQRNTITYNPQQTAFNPIDEDTTTDSALSRRPTTVAVNNTACLSSFLNMDIGETLDVEVFVVNDYQFNAASCQLPSHGAYFMSSVEENDVIVVE